MVRLTNPQPWADELKKYNNNSQGHKEKVEETLIKFLRMTQGKVYPMDAYPIRTAEFLSLWSHPNYKSIGSVSVVAAGLYLLGLIC